jgi:hypothetical protein
MQLNQINWFYFNGINVFFNNNNKLTKIKKNNEDSLGKILFQKEKPMQFNF